jgi:protein required for attachment to host cells
MQTPRSHTTWIAVADDSRARIFLSRSDQPMRELENLVQPESRLDEHERHADAKGHYDSAGIAGSGSPGHDGTIHGSGHSAEPRTSTENKHEAQFARRLAQRLEGARREGAYEHLILIAAPRFLGRVRAQLSPQVMKRLAHTIAKDLTKLSVTDIESRLHAQSLLEPAKPLSPLGLSGALGQ